MNCFRWLTQATRTRFSRAGRCGILACTVFSTALGAQIAEARPRHPTSPVTLAQRIAREARRAYDNGDYQTACTKYEESLRLEQRFGIALNVAHCHAFQNKLARAIFEYRSLLQEASDPDDRDEIETELEKLNSRVARIQLRSTETVLNQLRRAKISLDSVPVDMQDMELGFPVDIGRHFIEISVSGFLPLAKVVEVGENGAVSIVDVELSPLVDARHDPPPPPESLHKVVFVPVETKRSGTSPIVYVSGATAAATLITGGVFGALSLSDHNQSLKLCGGALDNCHIDQTNQARGLIESRDRNKLVASVSLGVAAVSAAAALYFYLAPPSREERVTGRVAPLRKVAGLLTTGYQF